jgi:hypothetical protein
VNALAAAEYTGVANAVTAIESLEEDQDAGKGTESGAVDQRLVLVGSLLDQMRSLSKAAKVLDVETHPDVATKMRMSGIPSVEELIIRANVFHSTLQPIEAEFIALGAAATVAADLQAAITAEGARGLKLTGCDLRIGGTAGLGVAISHCPCCVEFAENHGPESRAASLLCRARELRGSGAFLWHSKME